MGSVSIIPLHVHCIITQMFISMEQNSFNQIVYVSHSILLFTFHNIVINIYYVFLFTLFRFNVWVKIFGES